MAYNEQLAERIVQSLFEKDIAFSEKKMFGGIAFMIAEKMCIGVVKEDMMLRVLDEKYDDLVEQPHANPMKFTGRTMKGFIFVSPEGLDTKVDLNTWIAYGIEFGRFGVVEDEEEKIGNKA